MEDLQVGIRYHRPPDSGASWYRDVLADYMKDRLPRSVTIQIEILGGGGVVVGKLVEAGSGSPTDMHGAVQIEPSAGAEGILSIPCEDIEAVTLLRQEVDTSDELRG